MKDERVKLPIRGFLCMHIRSNLTISKSEGPKLILGAVKYGRGTGMIVRGGIEVLMIFFFSYFPKQNLMM